ncbi:hypothetical protein BCR32DRAFT_307489 [Anaeromyces robustus]|uniref:Uncharacterized protein n=1 Tax=Anaeromyces robustus TaxID=1754192 RepID=A0A1Y1XE08_9FUNG|nr:hypothetical protein BCR32DRAFT_307489 [Anaeromyces robustus]|eukprot:ORX83969.1 hypothetical protein BCR32DRAFT_307489 [Anaeromyces robustus]
MYYNKLGYLLLITLFINKVFCSYVTIDDKKNGGRYYMFKNDKDYFVCTGLDNRIPGTCIAYPGGSTCSGGAEMITGCVDQNGVDYKNRKFGSILDATDPFRCDGWDKAFGSGNCDPNKTYVKTDQCFTTPVSSNRRAIINVKLDGKYEYDSTKNGYYLTKYGWCKNKEVEKPKQEPQSQSTLNCTSYKCKRCVRKLPSVTWKCKSNGWETTLSSGTLNKYCGHSNCQKAYDDENGKCKKRESYWKSCRDDILSELKGYYKQEFKVVSKTENYC